MTIREIVSGGQTGADIAAWLTAKRFGIRTSGFMPRGFLVEQEGGGGLVAKPEYAALYNAVEHESAFFRDRTRANCVVSDVLLLFGDQYSPGSKATRRAWFSSRRDRKNFASFIPDPTARNSITTSDLIVFASSQLKRPVSVFVAGNRESRSPGIGEAVQAHLAEAFSFLGYQDQQEAARDS